MVAQARIAILDDYQNVVLGLADRTSLHARTVVFTEPFKDAEDVVARNLTEETTSMREGGWQTSLGLGLADRTLGILGLGNVGSGVARVGLAFGMKVIAWSQNLTPDRAAEHGVRSVTKDQLFAESDVLTVNLVLSERTRGLVGPEELNSMKRSAILVNTSRGPIVDEGALVEVLRRGGIHRAAIDVYDTEPLPADHPLRTLPNALLTGHIGYVTRDQYAVFYQDAVAAIAAFQAGRPIRVAD